MEEKPFWFIFFSLVLAFSLVLGEVPEAKAFHLRAGEITAKSDTASSPNPFRFHFKLVTYRLTFPPYDDLTATIFFGDGTSATVPRHSVEILPNNTTRQVFYASHTYPGLGSYSVLYQEVWRNGGIINMSNSGTTTFLLQSSISINPQVGINHTPQFSVPPLDVAAPGQIFIHFPGAYDLDQDSLSFRLVSPLGNPGRPATPIPAVVGNYKFPNDPQFGGTAINDPVTGATQGSATRFDLNPRTGEIRWNAPNLLGSYNIAFVVEEWRRAPGRRPVKLSEILRDMQIRVEPTLNTRPALIIPRDTCVIAKSTLNALVSGSDPNSPPDPLTFNAYSGIIPPAIFTQIGGTSGQFQWTPQCSDISAHTYQVIFKVTDSPSNNDPGLIDMRAWNVKVVGPKPTGLMATLLPGKQMLLSWDPYLTSVCGNAQKIHIYRRVNPANFNPASCETGVPASTGYLKIGEVPANVNAFTDTNNGQELKLGSNYCYMIYATFPNPKGGESLASDEICAEVPALSSVLTKVSVSETSKTAGEIEVHWSQPLIGLANLTGPFEYRLWRAYGLQRNLAYVQVFSSTNMNDTTFTDSGLNTLDSTFRYKIELYSRNAAGQLSVLESGNEASSVRLNGKSSGTEMNLEWQYETPWDNSQRKHIVYRKINNIFVPIDSVLANSNAGNYTDKGTYQNLPLIIGREYCYKILTVGKFTIKRVPPLVENYSQEICRVIRDKVPPCPPELSLRMLKCDSLEQASTKPPYQHKLNWQPSNKSSCGTDVKGYNIYHRQTSQTEFKFITFEPSLNFVHRNLTSPAACYLITAVDSSDNESAYSNIVCQDVCYFLELPNIITPNNDRINDTFRPRQFAFIRSVKFSVYNRWGMKIYDQTTGPSIDWAGVNDKGERIPDGTYYYLAEIEFAGQNPTGNRRVYKGWVEVLK